MADRVKGMPILKKSEFLTSWPSLRRMPMPAILAEAPMGVQLLTGVESSLCCFCKLANE